MLYVSRAPWGIYEILEEFFQRHENPGRADPLPARMGSQLEASAAAARARPQAPPDRGDDAPLPRHALRSHRRQRPARPGTLRRDRRPPPGRVLAVYIRDVRARGPERAAEVAAMAEALRASGAHLVLAADSAAIADDAARLGLISAEACRRSWRASRSGSGRGSAGPSGTLFRRPGVDQLHRPRRRNRRR